ncbi:M15 family metallopeptidase [Nonomuraea sp. NPDC050783]|uniref:M15 family metallopeptidase n=1 Tax=Nonomuraea sp. NPDC050783 TaxID=3154634 RepID=UPI003466CED5
MPDIILMADARVSAVPVEESGEPLVDLREVPSVRLDPRLADDEGAYAHVRSGHVERLRHAQSLLPDGLRLLVVEAFRPLALQEHYYHAHADRLRAAHPDWPEERVHVQTSRSLSPPPIGPHVCGAAIDLTLCTEDGQELDMGTPVNADPEETDDACYTDSADVSAEARGNRRLLGDALTAAGFVNYPTEWWHWSYGDRYWALMTGAPAALHGLVDWSSR